MVLKLKIIGTLLVILALTHAIFPKYFNWKTEFQKVSLINKEMMYVHTFFIGLIVLLMGILCISSGKQLVETKLGQRIAFGFAIFWGCRLFIQFFGYSTTLWKGKKIETSIHILFTVFWLYLTFIFTQISQVFS